MALIGRNDPCPCGSGKKYKKCCEGNAEARATFELGHSTSSGSDANHDLSRRLAEYAEPLTDATDGSVAQIERAFSLAVFFYGVGMMKTEAERRAALDDAAAEIAPHEPARGRFLAMAEAMLERHAQMFASGGVGTSARSLING